MKYHFVTSFNSSMYSSFGRSLMESWVKHLPKDCKVTCWIEGPYPRDLPQDRRFIFRMIDTQELFKSFVSNYGNVSVPKVAPGNEFRFRYMSFWFKVFGLTQTFLEEQYVRNETVIWLDADVRLQKDLTEETLAAIQGESDITWLDRDVPWYAIESGFMMFKRSPVATMFMIELQNIYLTGYLFDLQEWHDGFVLKALSKMYRQRLLIRNLNEQPTNRDAFKTSILNGYMEHYKGNLKTNVD